MAAESLRHHPKSRSTERAGRAPQLRPTREEALRPSRGESSLRKRYDCFDSVLVSCVEIVALMCSGGGSAIAERRERGAQGREGREESVSGSATSFPNTSKGGPFADIACLAQGEGQRGAEKGSCCGQAGSGDVHVFQVQASRYRCAVQPASPGKSCGTFECVGTRAIWIGNVFQDQKFS